MGLNELSEKELFELQRDALLEEIEDMNALIYDNMKELEKLEQEYKQAIIDESSDELPF